MKAGSLFSGYDGLGMAVDALFPGTQRTWFCEWDDAPSKILAHHWPTVPNHRDITQVEWDHIEPVDILTGGYPCQPFSAAGQRKGTNDERHLWPYVREAIRHLRPRYTLLENVAGHRSLGFDRVLGDLAEDGMHVRWTSLRASDVGAPHHRERLFILVTDPNRRERDGERSAGRSALARKASAGSGVGVPADDHSIRCGQGSGQPSTGEPEKSTDLGGPGALPDATNDGCERTGPARTRRAGPPDHHLRIEWGAYAPAVRRWERLTRPSPPPTKANKNGKPQLSAEFAEWMMGLPSGHVTNPDIGITRANQLKAIGNGVCPQQAVAAYASMGISATRQEFVA